MSIGVPTLRAPPLPGLSENDEPRRLALPSRGVPPTGEPGPEATAASRADSVLRGPSSWMTRRVRARVGVRVRVRAAAAALG